MNSCFHALFVVSIASACNVAGADEKPSSPANTAISVTGEDGKSQTFDAAALAKLPQHTVHAEAHGKALTCDGANLDDVLAAAGAPQGEALRGKALSSYVRVSARDGYRVVYSLAELDPAVRADVPIVTSHCDGAALDDKDGPFRIIVPGDKRPARWIRQVTAIDLLRSP